jgi:hypothetical protein
LSFFASPETFAVSGITGSAGLSLPRAITALMVRLREYLDGTLQFFSALSAASARDVSW